MDPNADPALFISDLQDANKNDFFAFYAYSFLNVHLHHSSKLKSHKEVKKSRFLISYLLKSLKLHLTEEIQIGKICEKKYRSEKRPRDQCSGFGYA